MSELTNLPKSPIEQPLRAYQIYDEIKKMIEFKQNEVTYCYYLVDDETNILNCELIYFSNDSIKYSCDTGKPV